ncbi:MAG: GGDEF domain-containing protein [Desulfovibrionales bacterium]|nr:GGDEF domain-containing protein [Desulfovibrionales bacterium]
MSTISEKKAGDRPDSNTRSWFAVSIAITVFLAVFLLWHLIYSYNLMVSFKEREFVIERSSWQLLLFAESMQMSALVSATSGDLNWEKTYQEIEPRLQEVLHKIPELLPSTEVKEIVQEINGHLEVIKEIEKEAFRLVSRGEKDKAYMLLSGWEYTKNRMDFSDRTWDLTELIQKRLQERTSFDTTRLAILLVLGGLGVLVLSWVITIRIWRVQVRNKQEAEEELALKNKELEKLYVHDTLTGAYNRAKFDEIMEKELGRYERYGRLFSIVIMDIDDFKEINDTLGHLAGDKVLQEMVQLMIANTRDADLLCRWGGEEFVLVCPETDSSGVKLLAENLRQLVAEHDFECGRNITISLGATMVQPQDTQDNMVARADKAMYLSKQQGKNCCNFM